MFEILIIKFLSGSSNLEELLLLKSYLQHKENVDIFNDFVKINYYSIYTIHDINRKEILDIVQKRIYSEQKKFKDWFEAIMLVQLIVNVLYIILVALPVINKI